MSDQGTVWVGLIQAELGREYHRRDRIDARATAVATSAAGLAAFVFAALAVVKGKDFVLHGVGGASLMVTTVGFLTSCGLAALATFNRSYEVATSNTLTAMLSSHWQDSEVTARNLAARLDLKTLTTLRSGNNWKSILLLAALISQLVGVLGLTMTTVLVW